MNGYLVTRGEYEDKTVLAVFEDKSEASEYADTSNAELDPDDSAAYRTCVEDWQTVPVYRSGSWSVRLPDVAQGMPLNVISTASKNPGRCGLALDERGDAILFASINNLSRLRIVLTDDELTTLGRAAEVILAMRQPKIEVMHPAYQGVRPTEREQRIATAFLERRGCRPDADAVANEIAFLRSVDIEPIEWRDSLDD